MGAGTISILKRTPGGLGDHNIVEAEFTFSSSYSAGGDSFTLSALKLNKLTLLLPQPAKGGYLIEGDAGNLKFKAYQVGTHSHTENTGATYTQNATTGLNVLAVHAEVAAAADLSTIGAVKFIAIGT